MPAFFHYVHQGMNDKTHTGIGWDQQLNVFHLLDSKWPLKAQTPVGK